MAKLVIDDGVFLKEAVAKGQISQNAGDVPIGGAGGALTRLPIGTAGQALAVNSGGNGLEYKTVEFTKSIIVESPLATDDIGIWEPGVEITITKVVYRVTSATSVTFNINHSGGTDLWVSDKVASTTRTSVTAFTDATCTANNYIRFQASAVSGTPSSIEITITYTFN